jgi:hypothetical protein
MIESVKDAAAKFGVGILIEVAGTNHHRPMSD